MEPLNLASHACRSTIARHSAALHPLKVKRNPIPVVRTEIRNGFDTLQNSGNLPQ
jgi:hypothetical protein